MQSSVGLKSGTPENFILLLKVSYGLSLVLSMCDSNVWGKQINSWVECLSLLWILHTRASSSPLTSSSMLLCGWRVCLSHLLHVKTAFLSLPSCMCESEQVWHIDCNNNNMLYFFKCWINVEGGFHCRLPTSWSCRSVAAASHEKHF